MRYHTTHAVKKPIVLLDFGTWELTLRELVLAVSIVSVLVALGVFIASIIDDYVKASQLKYRQAVQIDKDVDHFKWAISTDIGNGFVEGTVAAIDPVCHDKLDGKWMWIAASYQKYQKHTKVVYYTVRDSEGRSHRRSRIETYWSWDTYERWHNKATHVEFLDVNFSYGKFDFSGCSALGKTVSNGYHRRIVFKMLPAKMHGTFFSELKNGTISNGTMFMQGMDLKKAYESMTSSYSVLVFWTIWLLVVAVTVFVFFYKKNDWLEDTCG